MRPKRSLGQNFLQDNNYIALIVDALLLSARDTVVEIGPGLGALTEQLVLQAGQVIAVEFDRDLVPVLEARFSSAASLRIVNEDALTVDFPGLLTGTDAAETKLAANLPYNISTPILQRLIDCRMLFSTLVLMFQKEVVDRITAKPGGRERGFLSVLVENAFDTQILFDVPPEAFRPVPKVWTSVVRLTPRPPAISNDELFRSLLSRAFSQKRKTLLNNLKSYAPEAAEMIRAVDIDPSRRAETLTLDEWASLITTFDKKGRTPQ